MWPKKAHRMMPVTVKKQTARRRFDLLWYLSLCLVTVAVIVIPSGLLAFGNLRSLYRHFTWGLLISPSCIVFLCLTGTSIFLPLNLLSSIPIIFSEPSFAKKLTFTLRTIALIVGLSILIQIVLWGAYPLGYDADGREHLRLIPFLPWPRLSFFTWIWGS
jgi:hypothetical protein